MKKSVYIILSIAVLTLGSCSNLTKIMKSNNINEKYKAAIKYYESGDYYRAGLLFEDLLPNMIGKPEAEQVQFYFAYCHYYQSQFELSAHYFKSFHDTYQRSNFANEALYMHAYSLYKATPEYNLDQSNTEQAIQAVQDFLNMYPTSNYVSEAEDLIKELRENLEVKAYNIAKQYQKLRRYKAAVIACDNFQKDFPDSDYKEEITYMKVLSQYEMSKVSLRSLQKERYEEAVEYYYYFLDKYPESKYLKPAESIYKSCQKELASLNALQKASKKKLQKKEKDKV
ncbi:outer membrane protein assembly factor BamD [Flammeovirgaceae bacterium SG7u.111]|nr:outer membrane protein assembly factor BamD [Flammeovirgaceae bacterium SG7u.132]WPO36318.1 outer membrane protein assembly factor BamD [Flammeovirgaceae bacterium SG7u.111]